MSRWDAPRRPLAAAGVAALALSLTAGAAALTAGHPDRSVRVSATAKCGIERWPVKTLADPDATQIGSTVRTTTVDALTRLPVTIGIGGARGVGAERTRFRVHAKLVGIKTESDTDFHLVIADPKTGAQMIVEFPNQTCTNGAPANLRKRMEKARAAVQTACGFAPSSTFRHLSGNVTVIGVAFFDFLHRQTGHAPNGIELHPVLSFSGSCS